MQSTAKIAICAVLMLALAAPVLAGGPPKKGSTVDSVKSTVYSGGDALYRGGAKVVGRTEELAGGFLKNTFSLFNPCLDLVKSCTNIALAPIERPVTYIENRFCKPKTMKKAGTVPQPKKPEVPKE
jgi:hypothetical protein